MIEKMHFLTTKVEMKIFEVIRKSGAGFVSKYNLKYREINEKKWKDAGTATELTTAVIWANGISQQYNGEDLLLEEEYNQYIKEEV